VGGGTIREGKYRTRTDVIIAALRQMRDRDNDEREKSEWKT